jgi:tRNA(Ile)-lysidine synthase
MPLTSTNLVLRQFFHSMDQFFPFEAQPTIAVATSGGPDSLALCLLLNQWIIQKNGKLVALTVDHHLRSDSTAEAKQVNQWLTSCGIEHHTLSWNDEKPTADVQNKARMARHQHLEKWCETHHILHLFFAHHQEDQEETILQRLLHASGPIGLQGMQACTYRSFGRLLRPLLSFSKQQLITFLNEQQQSYICDPSNLNTSFERVKLRTLLPQLTNLTTTPLPLSQVGLKCHDFAEIAHEAVTKFFLRSITLNPLGFLILQKDSFLSLSIPLQTLTLSHCLQAIGGNIYPFSSKQLSSLIEKIRNHKNTTLGGCFIIIKSSQIYVIREERAISKSTDIPQNKFCWDNRFLIEIPDYLLGGKVIPYCELPIDYKIKKDDVPNYILKTLPFFQQPDGTISSLFSKEYSISWRLVLKNKLLPFC